MPRSRTSDQTFGAILIEVVSSWRKNLVRIGLADVAAERGRDARITVAVMVVRDRDRVHDDTGSGVEANARLTGSTAAVLLVLLALEGITVLELSRLLRLHVFVGMLLVPPVLLKTVSTGYRFGRYYTGDPPYVRRGAPHLILRILGPIVGVLTFAVLATGIALLWAPSDWRHTTLFLHKATFVLWFAVMTVHVLGHLVDTYRLAPRDWTPHGPYVPGAWLRRATLVVTVLAGIGLGLFAMGQVDTWLRRRA
jgi:hypothetical protein